MTQNAFGFCLAAENVFSFRLVAENAFSFRVEVIDFGNRESAFLSVKMMKCSSSSPLIFRFFVRIYFFPLRGPKGREKQQQQNIRLIIFSQTSTDIFLVGTMGMDEFSFRK